jgi:large subunit ribosomal protein L40
MKAPSTALLRTFSPLWRSEAPLATVRGCLAQQQQQQRADFSSTPANQARDKRNKKDPRISMPARMELLQLQFRIRTAG